MGGDLSVFVVAVYVSFKRHNVNIPVLVGALISSASTVQYHHVFLFFCSSATRPFTVRLILHQVIMRALISAFFAAIVYCV